MQSGVSLSESLQLLQALTESLEGLLSEEGYRYPFRHKSDLGQGPRGKHHHKAKKWDCDNCGRYYCDCEGIGDNEGHHKHVKINRAYKLAYDKEYKAGHYPKWRERRSSRKERHDRGKSRPSKS